MNLNMEPMEAADTAHNKKQRGKLFYISTSASDDQQPSSVDANQQISDEDDDSSWSEYSDDQDEPNQPISFEKLPKRSMSAAGGFTYFLSNKPIYPSQDKLSLLSTMFNSQQNLTKATENHSPNNSEDSSDKDCGLEFNARNSRRLQKKSQSAMNIPHKGTSQDTSYASTLVGSESGAQGDQPPHSPHSAPGPLEIPDAPLSARPQSPRTIRRNMLASELSESLRKSILWERETRARMLLGGHNNSSGMLNAKLREKFARQEAEAEALARQREDEEEEYFDDDMDLDSAAHNARIKNRVDSIKSNNNTLPNTSNTSHRRYKSTPERSDNQYPHKMLSTSTINNNPSSSSIAGRNLTENDLSKYRRPRTSTNNYLSSSPDYHG
ncbi:hypothetical protein E3P92_00758 [Wallemia ichthyophaga]|uniref:DUF3295 domain-containing protein n=1 Tax=Wallemia ichthyophaga TaxID=245174 RepID=A0A4T0IPS6_WALIC|nr:hypothetical protein E3P91_00367 [Wallemia ichthyophaga]TIB14033.1 hypothetical protein E3P90_01415 [Wallemia ichthyophaga]TIB15935.1 hypothetical protein E3P93_01166 [Wallemia ichthyophaga]TIB18126.1 hypothetical protein E3P92_00758 [Wallemia ichthyophaga]TIB22397.1 hypothetical protein E3P89_02092 [Wallemia ichthyophaga]